MIKSIFSFADNLKNKNLNDKEKIKSWLEKRYVSTFYIHDDLTVDINDSVVFYGEKIKVLPFQLGKIQGSLDISNNNIKTFKNIAKEIDGCLYMYGNLCQTFDYLPEKVTGHIETDIIEEKEIKKLATMKYFGSIKFVGFKSEELPPFLQSLLNQKGFEEVNRIQKLDYLLFDFSFNEFHSFLEKLDLDKNLKTSQLKSSIVKKLKI